MEMSNDFVLSALRCKTTTLQYVIGVAQASLPLVLPSIRLGQNRRRDWGGHSMLQDLAADGHTAWQLENGALTQPSD